MFREPLRKTLQKMSKFESRGLVQSSEYLVVTPRMLSAESLRCATAGISQKVAGNGDER